MKKYTLVIKRGYSEKSSYSDKVWDSQDTFTFEFDSMEDILTVLNLCEIGKARDTVELSFSIRVNSKEGK